MLQSGDLLAIANPSPHRRASCEPSFSLSLNPLPSNSKTLPTHDWLAKRKETYYESD
jgi:hypothetical protein